MRFQLFQKTRWWVFFLVVAGACSHQPANDRESSDEAEHERGATHSVLPSEEPVKDGPSISASNHLGLDRESEPPSDERCRELVVGTWKDEYQGQRTMTVRPDGTATMVVELEGLSARLYADRMTFEEEWSVDGGQLKLLAVGGEPEARVNLILKTMGNLSDYKILELTGDRILLLDADGTTQYDWRRIKDE
jgi:hypothetical protein